MNGYVPKIHFSSILFIKVVVTTNKASKTIAKTNKKIRIFPFLLLETLLYNVNRFQWVNDDTRGLQMADPRGFEPPVPCLGGKCAICPFDIDHYSNTRLRHGSMNI